MVVDVQTISAILNHNLSKEGRNRLLNDFFNEIMNQDEQNQNFVIWLLYDAGYITYPGRKFHEGGMKNDR